MIVSARPSGRVNRLSRRALAIAAALATGLALLMPAGTAHSGSAVAAISSQHGDA